MIGLYLNLYPTIVSFLVSLVLLFYIIAHPFSKISFSAHHHYYISFAIANIFRSMGIFLGERYCVSYGFYLYFGGFLYLTYGTLIHGIAFNESIKAGNLAIKIESFGKHFIAIHVILVIQMILVVYFDDEVASEIYCIYNMQSIESDIFTEPFMYIAVYPLIIAWSLLVSILFYGAFVLKSSHLSGIMQPVVTRLRYYILLIAICVVPSLLYLIINVYVEDVNYLWKIFLFNHSVVIALYQLDYFLHMNPIFNQTLFLRGIKPAVRASHPLSYIPPPPPSMSSVPSRDQAQHAEGTSASQSTTSAHSRRQATWLQLLFIKWDVLMYKSSRNRSMSCELLPSESTVPSEYYNRETDERT